MGKSAVFVCGICFNASIEEASMPSVSPQKIVSYKSLENVRQKAAAFWYESSEIPSKLMKNTEYCPRSVSPNGFSVVVLLC